MTDDSVALQSTDFTGAMIYVPKGTYLVDGTWTISDALYMYCEPGVTFKLKNNAAANSRILTVSVDGFVLEGQATFDGNRANQSTPSGQYLLHHTDRTDVDLTLYRLTGSPNQGARFVNSTRCSIRVHRLDDTGRQGIFFTNTAGNNIDHNYAWVDWGDRSDNPANDDGIIEINHIDGTSAGTINGNVIGGRGKMHNAPTGSNVVVFEIWGPGAGNRIVSPWCEGGTIGCSLAKGQTHSSIHCDHAFDQKTIGLEIAESDYCQIYGTVDGNSNAGTGCSVDGQGGGAAGNEVFATVRRTVSRAFSNISADDTVFQMNASITTGTGLEVNSGAQLSCLGVQAYGVINCNGGALKAISWFASSGTIKGGGFTGVIRNTTTQAFAMTVTTGTLDDLVVDVSYQNVTATFFLNGGTGTVGTNVVLRWSGTNYSIANGGVFYALWNRVGELFGPGTPEGVLTAGIGSTYRRTNGGAGTSFYVKQSGTGNTGWVGK